MSKKKFSAVQLSLYCENASYSYENKSEYLAMGRSILKQLAKVMGLTPGTHSVSLCEGGIAVSGEIILHSDTLYLQICNNWRGRGAAIMFRTCKGRKDYTGGPNQWARVEELEDLPTFAAKLLRLTQPQFCDAA